MIRIYLLCLQTDRQQNLSSSTGESRTNVRDIAVLVILISLSPHIVSIALFSTSSAKNASFFLIMNIHLLGEETANVKLCLFCRLRQHYKVHTYVISMEFSAVNRRRLSRETPLEPGAKKDGCFRRLKFCCGY